GQQYNNLPLTF
nr:immunoglobulin light chain junction region [Macaca mulatta]